MAEVQRPSSVPPPSLMTAATALAATTTPRTTAPNGLSLQSPATPQAHRPEERRVSGPTRRWYFSRD